MKTTLQTMLVFCLVGISTLFAQYPYEPEPDYPDHSPYHPYKIQLALVLDVSGSMDGLLAQAQSQLWHIVNAVMEEASYDAYPELEIALIEYGNNSLGYRNRYAQMRVPLTYDLDWLSDGLFSLRTGGSYEYAGAALELALDAIPWSRNPQDIRMMYIAGNESFWQGPVSAQQVLREAVRRDISVHTIYCGDYRRGISHGWEEAAFLGRGSYSQIEQGYRPQYHVPTYHQLNRLNAQLNATYLPYGNQGNQACKRQLAQDRNAQRFGQGYAAQRYLSKSTPVYRNPDWDLVDALAAGKIQLEDIPTQDLPPQMRGMSMGQKKAYIAQTSQKRVSIQREMRSLRHTVKEVKPHKGVKPPRPGSTSKPAPASGQSSSPACASQPHALEEAIIKATKEERQMKEAKSTPSGTRLRNPSSPQPRPSPKSSARPKTTIDVSKPVASSSPSRIQRPSSRPAPQAQARPKSTSVEMPKSGRGPSVKQAPKPRQEYKPVTRQVKPASRVDPRRQTYRP